MKKIGMKKTWIRLLWIVAIIGMLSGCNGKGQEKGQEDRQEEKQTVDAEVREGEQEERLDAKKGEGLEDKKGERQKDRQEGRLEARTELSEDFLAVVQSFSSLFLAFDEDGYRFNQVLDSVEAYLSGEEKWEETIDKVREALRVYQEEMEGLEEFTLEEGLMDQLAACGISAEEYKAFGNSRENEIYNYTIHASTLLEYLESAEELQESYEDLAFFYSVHRDEQDSMRGYYYYGCLNYWFTEANEEERAYLDKEVISKIKAYLPKNPVWYEHQEDVEEAVMAYLDEIEEINGRLAKYVGEAQEELYGMEQDYQELMNKIEEKRVMEEKLARLKEINVRIEEINQEAAKAKEDGDEERLSVLKEEFEALVAEYENLVE